MKTHHKTYTLLALFFAGLVIMAGLEYFGVPTEKERRLRESLVLPELLIVPEERIRKVEIQRGNDRLAFERRDQQRGRWQMVEPQGVAAAGSRLETVVRNLKGLRQSPDSGDITGPSGTFGLDPPAATIRLWTDQGASPAKSDPPVATLAIGKATRGIRFVRSGGTAAIEVADAKLLNFVEIPASEWRDPVLMGVATFQVAAVTIQRPGAKLIRAERGRRGHWTLSDPLTAPAQTAKVESLIAALASLRVVDGPKGFVADDVRDFAPFGLSPPTVTVELATDRASDGPRVLHVGKSVPDRADRVYVRQGDQDDVVIVDAKALSEIPQTAVSLRSQKVADLDPAAVTAIEIRTRAETFTLKKRSNDWELTAPRQEKADTITALSFLQRLESLQTSEFLDPNRIHRPEVDPPVMTIKVWQTSRGPSGTPSQQDKLALELRIGRLDAVTKSIFAQLANDNVVLALPDNLIEVLPKNEYAFRDRTILSLNPVEIRKLIVTRVGKTDELVPSATGEPNHWQMLRPIDAPADTRSVTQALAVLANLRADDYVAGSQGSAAEYGLDQPLLDVRWESDRAHHLKVGAQVRRAAAYYASVDDRPGVFTLKAETLKPFEADFRDHLVMSFPLAQAERMLLRWGWPRRTVTIRRRVSPPKGQPEWVGEPGSDVGGIDLSRMPALAMALSHLETTRYAQYSGDIPPITGLNRPRLTIEVKLGHDLPPRVLRVGDATIDRQVFAAEGSSSAGPVFLLPAASWNALIESGERFEPLPSNVFAPAS